MSSQQQKKEQPFKEIDGAHRKRRRGSNSILSRLLLRVFPIHLSLSSFPRATRAQFFLMRNRSSALQQTTSPIFHNSISRSTFLHSLRRAINSNRCKHFIFSFPRTFHHATRHGKRRIYRWDILVAANTLSLDTITPLQSRSPEVQ